MTEHDIKCNFSVEDKCRAIVKTAKCKGLEKDRIKCPFWNKHID